MPLERQELQLECRLLYGHLRRLAAAMRLSG
jgi:hypothetical protein